MEHKIWLSTALCKLAQTGILCLTVLPIPLQGDFHGLLQKIHMLQQCWNLACGGKEMWWHTPSFLKYITTWCMVHWSTWYTGFHWLHHIVIIFSKVQENDTLCLCYFFFPLFEMLSLALCDEQVCCKVANTVHQQFNIIHINCVYP